MSVEVLEPVIYDEALADFRLELVPQPDTTLEAAFLERRSVYLAGVAVEREVTLELSSELKAATDLYGARLFMTGEHEPEVVTSYVIRQETTHLAEGLRLKQREPQRLPFSDGHVRGFNGEPMVDITEVGYRAAQKAYLAGDPSQRYLAVRRRHDHGAAELEDELMQSGQVGDGFYHFSPYQQEVTDEVADELGFWPKYRRSYGWFYRKISANELEYTPVTIDQSNLETFQQVLTEDGITDVKDAPSHEIPGRIVHFHAATDTDRDTLINAKLGRIKQLDNGAEVAIDNEQEATKFLQQYAGGYLSLGARLQKSIGESLKTGKLDDLVRLSATQALKTLDCLEPDERQSLQELLSTPKIDQYHKSAIDSLSMVVRAQRYGIWHVVSKLADTGSTALEQPPTYEVGMPLTDYIVAQDAQMIDHIYTNTNRAANLMETMPGCPGGVSFTKQDPSDVSRAVFGAENSSESSGNIIKMNCPYCKEVQYGDPCAKVLSCTRCSAKVSFGRLVDPGDGGPRARRQAIYDKQRASERAKIEAKIRAIMQKKAALKASNGKSKTIQKPPML